MSRGLRGTSVDAWCWAFSVCIGAFLRVKVQNGFVERPIGRLRDECLNQHRLRSLPAARRVVELWRVDYNTRRPHKSLGGLTPITFANRSTTDHN